MVEAAILTCRWPGLRPTHPSQRCGLCLRLFFMVKLPHGQKIQGSLGLKGVIWSRLRIGCLHDFSVPVMVGFDPQEDAKWFRLSEGGIVLITQDLLDARAAKLG